jgi:1-acyl-sn-glycerol-3-phosphate acyltransferase
VLLFTAICCLLDFGWLTLLHRGLPPYAKRAGCLHKWCRVALRRLKVSCALHGEFPSDGLIISNHLSYLDIMVMSALHPCLFVSKKEVAAWPIFGWLATLSGTIYIDRERRSDVARVNEELLKGLNSGVPCVLFPEGTSSNGEQVLPFRSSLLQPAVECAAHITPAYISYSDPRACWFGDAEFFPHALELLGISRVSAVVRFSATRMKAEERKAAARAAYERVLELRQEELRPEASPARS